MWNDRLRIAERVEHDWRALSAGEQATVRTSLEAIDEDPILGAPLLQPLRGLWSYRVAHLRILYRIAPEARYVVIMAIVRAADGRSV